MAKALFAEGRRSSGTRVPSWTIAAKIALSYAILGSLWILLSGWLLHQLVSDPRKTAVLENLKGWFFVAVTALLLWGLLNHYFAELRRASDRVHELEERWKFALQGEGQGVWDWDLSSPVAFVSEEWKRTLGYGPDELTGRVTDWKELILPEDLPRVEAAIAKHLAGETPEYTSEHRIRCKDGHYKWIRDHGKVISRSADGKPLRFLGTHRDITEQKQAEELSRITERRFQLLFENARGIAVQGYGADGVVRFWNKASEQLFGFTAEEVIGQRLLERIVPEESQKELKQIAERMLETGTVAPVREVVLRRKDGTLLPAYINFTLLEIPGRGRELYLIDIDLTALRKAEAAMRQWADAFKHCAHGIAMGKPVVNEILVCNPALANMLGRPVEEIAGMPIRSIYAPQDWPLIERMIEECDRAGQARFEAYMLRKDGSFFPVQMDVVGVKDDAGKLLYRVATSQDITDRKKAERMIQQRLELQEQLANIASTVPGVICSFKLATDGQMSMPFATTAVEELYEVKPEDIRDDFSPVSSRIHSEDLKKISASINESARYMTPWKDTFRVKHTEKGEIWVEGHSVPHRQPDGSTIWHGFVQDVTERLRAEQAVLELSKTLEQRVLERTAELRAANKELDSFAYAVSHDLRAPLRAMSGFSQALLEDFGEALPPGAKSYLGEIKAASHQMGELIEGLLRLSRSTRGELRRDLVNISAAAQHILEELAERDPERRVAWTVEPGLEVRGDAGMLEIVLNNLLGNAWKYTARATKPMIRVTPLKAGVSGFCVSDNGAGFDMKYSARLFQPFQRLHREDEFPGIGIGLATVQRIVNRHGGTITVEAEPNCGATFCISLPHSVKESTEA
jgi:PAS domain S-box-containing protein